MTFIYAEPVGGCAALGSEAAHLSQILNDEIKYITPETSSLDSVLF